MELKRIVFGLFVLGVSAVGVHAVETLSLVTYNAAGNGVADWSTNSPHVQALGREMAYLQPDVVTFQEIPFTNSWRMPDFVRAYLPGFYLATNSGGDGYIRSVILSRFPITRSQSWLNRTNLAAFGYNGPFTRDLFEAEIAVPGFPLPVHAFTVHLKAGTDTTSAQRRTAEANTISNFLVNAFPSTNFAPYFLSGDMNEDLARPTTSSNFPIQTLVSSPTGLLLTTPVNPITGSRLTISSTSPFARYDYILPCALLFSNIAGSQVFRTSLLNPVPPTLNTNDDRVASDHLPVVMVFRNPYDQPFGLTSVARNAQTVALTCQAVPGQHYRVEISTNLLTWLAVTGDWLATNYSISVSVSANGIANYFRVARLP